jgi:AcrR family transcriptional regulator
MSEERREMILNAFRSLVRRYGVVKTTMQDVASECGISVGLIYKDFTNKEDLIDVYVDKIINQILSECRRLSKQDKDPAELLYDVIMGLNKLLGEYISQERGFIQCVFGTIQLGQMRQKTFKYKELFREQMETIFAEVLKKGRAKGVFQVENAVETAAVIIDCFAIYTFEVAFSDKTPHEILGRTERLYHFIVRALERRE